KMLANKLIQQYYVETPEGDYRLREETNLLGDQSVQYWKTVKRGQGLVREESNLQLSSPEFKDLTTGLSEKWLRKVRTVYGYLDFRLEVDTFLDFQLRVVEVEFDSVERAVSFQVPAWFGLEITDQQDYNNYSLWKQLND
ncbi:MAG: hypothetical protein Q8912_07005, partial [Bacillota bacterium]|nr:hypothetical protein [Bacillota bacterium]